MVTEKEYDAIVRDALKQSNGNENGWDTKEDGSQSESASEHEADEGKEITYRDVQLEEPSHPQLRSALDDPDTELWLVRVPRHDALRTGIEGTEIRTLDLPHEDSFGNDDQRAGVAIGNYVYREQSLVDETMRPAFVTTDKSGKAVMKVGKPFAKSISITFDVTLNSLTASKPRPRSFPSAPKGQKRRYFPIGSTKGNTGHSRGTLSSEISKPIRSPRKKVQILSTGERPSPLQKKRKHATAS